jgi:5-methyltetrahydrofolate--homocysteine methyltransferase
LITAENRAIYAEELKLDYEKVRQHHAKKKTRTRSVTLDQARENGFIFDWDNYQPPIPKKLGVTAVSIGLTELVDYIDRTSFFLT